MDAPPLISDAKELRRTAKMVLRRLGDEAVQGVSTTCSHLIERLELGVDHTIVALVGGTGSGKSSLFNALIQMDFAKIGPLRPTTERPTACVWGGEADTLLDWLGIAREDQIRRDSILEDHIAGLRGLILLDLPDYDSQEPAHRIATERILPQADLLVWVTDPQKYADPALHARYLEEFRGREASLLVVLNQVDRLADDDVSTVRAHLAQLLQEAGVAEPQVMVTSAWTGQGIEETLQHLVEATRRHTAAAARVGRELGRAAEVLVEALGDPGSAGLGSAGSGRVGEVGATGAAGAAGAELEAGSASDNSWRGLVPAWVNRAAVEAVARLMDFSGGNAACGALARREAVSPAGVPSADRLQALLIVWLDHALEVLPRPWAAAVGHCLGSAKNIGTRLGEAMTGIAIPPPPTGLRAFFGRRRAALEQSEAYRARLTEVFSAIVQRTMTAPTLAVLEDWSAARDSALGIAGRANVARRGI
ncbi:MAG: 50S ribosome-binding GTPase [Micrococcales bacterium]|nr:50S ribosome-binding GTPase [Micrococcales bacterium]